MALQAALRKGSAGPPELQNFQLRQQLWQRFGVHLEDALREWPEQQLADAIEIMGVEVAVSSEDNSQSTAQSEHGTEMAYEALRAKAR